MRSIFALLLLSQLSSADVSHEDAYRVRVTVALSPRERAAFVLEVHPEWAPLGAARFGELLKEDFFSDVRFFRVIPNFVAQFGLNGDPSVTETWKDRKILDDPVVTSNKRGSLTFASSGPNTRTTQLFLNFRDNARLDRMGFSPFAIVVEGMEVVDRIYSAYGDGPPRGRGPKQGRIVREGNPYLSAEFPELSYIVSAERIS
mmetsp:Transcript_16678/g.63424  ORF Transcript_16678/g.63424 Transcript_16678/m.63424 type:complete len:202 (-) Transcript_16678:34-639(-)